MCDCKGCAVGTSKTYIILVNLVSLLAGCGLLGLSIWLMDYFSQYDDPVLIGVAVWGPMTISNVMVVSALFGIIGSCCFGSKQGCAKCSLGTYLVFSLALWVAVLMLTSILFFYTATADKVANLNGYELEGAAQELNTWQLAIFNKCCYTPGYSNIHVKSCGEGQNHHDACEAQRNLLSDELCSCYTDLEEYIKVSDKISTEDCQAWEQITFKGEQWVGNNSTGCGGGSPRVFQEDFADYVHRYVFPVCFSMLGISLFMLLASCCTCCLLGTKDPDVKYTETPERDDGTIELTGDQAESITMA